MGIHQSAEVTRALKLVANGMTAYAAAKKTGIALSTIYRAIKRNKSFPERDTILQVRRRRSGGLR